MNYFIILDLYGFRKEICVDKETFIVACLEGFKYHVSKPLLMLVGEEKNIAEGALVTEILFMPEGRAYDSYTQIFKLVFTNKKE